MGNSAFDIRKYVFFLGGHDAEMVEIRNILKERGAEFYDKKLSWGAKLSDYKAAIDNLPKNKIPVFIELIIDCPYPDDIFIIDHHDENAGKDKKTSIEQIAELLCIELTKEQQLISANDIGHIRAMKNMCATDEEIERIRRMDREAQGVTPEDERLAEESINNQLEEVGINIAIINSRTNKTSAVFDRIYDKYRHIFIFTPDGEMNYSGEGEMVFLLTKKYNEMKKHNPTIQFWSGGNLPDNGYFGSNFQLNRESFSQLIRQIQN